MGLDPIFTNTTADLELLAVQTALQAIAEAEPGLLERLNGLPDAEPHAMSQLADLLAFVHRELGDARARPIVARHGRLLAMALCAVPELAALRTRVRALHGSVRLELAVHAAASLLPRLGLEANVTESRGAPLLSIERCGLCAQVSNAPEPMCSNVEALLSALLFELCEEPTIAAEVECLAEGGAACRFRIRG